MALDYKSFSVAVVVLVLLRQIWPVDIWASPYFYLSGTSSGVFKTNETWNVMLDTDGDTLTAAQTIVHFDESLFTRVMLSNLNSKCSFWAPADPTLGFGNGSTPYFLDDNKVVISCGFSNPGYVTSTVGGDSVLAFTLNPYFLGSTSLTFSDSQFRYIGTTIPGGTDLSFDYSAISTEEAALATPSPTPFPTPTPAIPTPTTLKASDLNLVQITGSGSSGLAGGSYASGSSAVALASDDTIPPPPSMSPRPKSDPWSFLIGSSSASSDDDGNVLSIQSLRELLIPGKSTADKNLVLFNLFMMFVFITALAILIWRLIVASKTNRMKYRHMNDMLEGEISVIQSKLEGIRQGTGSDDELVASFEDLKKELTGKDK